MKCETLYHYLSDYLDGEVDTATRNAIDTHLQSCPRCAILAKTTAKTIDLSRHIAKPTLSPSRRGALIRTVQATFRTKTE